MASPSQPAGPPAAGRPRGPRRINQFWRRVTNGLELNQLWEQFRTDARASYGLYSREIDVPEEGVRHGRHVWGVAQQFFWAILEKLSPARRVILLLALVLVLFNPKFDFFTNNTNYIIGFDF